MCHHLCMYVCMYLFELAGGRWIVSYLSVMLSKYNESFIVVRRYKLCTVSLYSLNKTNIILMRMTFPQVS